MEKPKKKEVSLTPTQARAISFVDSAIALSDSVRTEIRNGDWKEAHRLVRLVEMDLAVLRTEAMPQVFKETPDLDQETEEIEKIEQEIAEGEAKAYRDRLRDMEGE